MWGIQRQGEKGALTAEKNVKRALRAEINVKGAFTTKRERECVYREH